MLMALSVNDDKKFWTMVTMKKAGGKCIFDMKLD